MAEIRSPLPGIFYRRPAPDLPPFKEVGDAVAVDDVIGLVEVMKSFIEIKADTAGTVVRFVTESEDAVMAGDVLVELEG
ncbi:acetyl-CoA carboxylase [Azospirillum sp. TSO22-1]|uniref:acetyl-CoA carboxylase n=1 Tax=Azospirillum sp. TSO22-1 TaxID=716789 RepID=UPI000D604603|nr:acetyl-CoA carboxylase [Azospirillum sp. TSO22-1]PWC45826.1 biotin attachment protein [Azospirillum sp. TSO22-1]